MNRARRAGAAMVAALALALSTAGSALAEEPAAEAATPLPVQAAAPAEAETTSQVTQVSLWTSVSDADLGKRGTGSAPSLMLLDADLDSDVVGNQVGDYVTTGDVNLTDQSLTGLNGIGQFTFNTGNNNSIQSNMLVIINVH